MLTKSKDAYALWLKIIALFPRIHRHMLGSKVESYFLELLETIFISLYLPPEQKRLKLATAISKLDGVKFFLQLAWENKCVNDQKYSDLSVLLDEIGRMIGGWKKGLENKTPPNQSGEKAVSCGTTIR